jgi:glycosyltransferase involved in cell wall biosynthesis
MPAVSVVITCYNYGRFLPEAVDSALGQTHGDLEVIVVDDGSTDETPELVARWRDEPRFRHVRQENAGQAAAKNHGARLARSPLVAYLDADDRWHPEKLARQVPRFGRAEVGVVYCLSLLMDQAGRTWHPPPRKPRRAPRAGQVTAALLFENFVPFSSSVIRRDLLQRVGGFDENLAMAIDWDLWLRISRHCAFDWVDAYLVDYRIGHGDQMSRKSLVRLDCCQQILEGFLRRHGAELPPGEVRQALAYSYAQRGATYRRHSRRRSLDFYRRSLLQQPWQRAAWVGLARTLLPGRRRDAAAAISDDAGDAGSP